MHKIENEHIPSDAPLLCFPGHEEGQFDEPKEYQVYRYKVFACIRICVHVYISCMYLSILLTTLGENSDIFDAYEIRSPVST